MHYQQLGSPPWRRRLAGAFYGTEEPLEMIPGWVVEAVVRGRLPNKPDDKCAFVLQPAEVGFSVGCGRTSTVPQGPNEGTHHMLPDYGRRF